MDFRNINFSHFELVSLRLSVKMVGLHLKIYCPLKSGYRPFGGGSPLEEKMARTKTNWEAVKLLQQNSARVNCKEHFALDGDAKIEIARVRKTRHSVYNINYHLVWIPKTRMRILAKPFSNVVEETIYRVCAWNEWTPLALQVMPDHIHFFMSAPPKWAPSEIVQSLKAWTSKELRARFSIIRDTRYADDLWASSYYCGTAGHVSAEQVTRYIRENSGKY